MRFKSAKIWLEKALKVTKETEFFVDTNRVKLFNPNSLIFFNLEFLRWVLLGQYNTVNEVLRGYLLRAYI